MADVLQFPDSSWTPPGDFNYKPRYLFIMEQYSPAYRRRLIKLLESCAFDTTQVEAAYLIPTSARQGIKPKDKDAKLFKPMLEKLLAEVAEDALIVPMGALCCKTIVGAKSILTAHGAIFTVDGRTMIPTLSPLQVVAYPDSLKTFVGDLKKIEDHTNGIVVKPMSKDHQLIDTVGKFKKMILRLWNSKQFAFDIESSSLNPFRAKPHAALVLVTAFSCQSGSAYVLPIDHKEAPWTDEQKKYIKKMVKQLLESKHNVKIAHNGQFDIMYLRKVLGIKSRLDFDTLLAHAIAVTEEKGTHYLKSLAWEYTDMGGYDDPLHAYTAEHPEANVNSEANPGTYAEIPLSILWPYAAADADVTYRLWEQFSPLVEAEFKWIFENVVMPATRALAETQYNGAPIDWAWYEHCQEVYPKLIQVELDRLREFPEVLEVERLVTKAALRKKQQERVTRFKDRSAKILEMERSDDEATLKKAATAYKRLVGDIERARLKPCVVEPVTFNPKSTPMKQMLLFDIMEFPVIKKTKSGEPSTDKEVLKSYWFDTKHPVVMALGKYTKIKTLYTMFVATLPDIIGDDGRLRGSYNVAGTETGRLSMSGPNLQQIPRNLQDDPREPFVDAAAWPSIKRLFATLDKDYVIIQFDYSQAELRVLAALARDPVLMSAYVNGEDVHQRVAAEAFGVPIDQVTKYQRTVAKTINFGLLYGQGAKKLAKTIGCTEEEAKEFIRIYFEKLPGVQRHIKKTKKSARKNGYVYSPYGRKRRLMSVFSPEQDIVAKAERQAVNSPIQATASDWTLLSISRITRWLTANNLLSQIILTVHDSIILRVHVSELARVYKMAKKIMENPPHDGWIDGVPIVADASVGLNWGQQKDVKTVEELHIAVEELLAKAA